MTSVTTLLSKYKKGLKIWKLQDFFLTEEGIDLEKFSIAQGYDDTVELLEEMMPQLMLNYQTDRLNTVVIESHSVLSEVMTSVTTLLSKYKKGLKIWKLQDFFLTEEGIDLEKFSIAQGYDDTVEFLEEKMPQLMLNYQTDRLNTVVIESHSVLSEVMASVTFLLSKYERGLKIWKLQDFFLAEERIDLEKFSIAQGYDDTVEFLEEKMPQLMLNYKTDRLNTVVIEPHSVLNKVIASLTALLSRYMSGLRVEKLQEFLLAEEGIDLEKFSFALGYTDVLEFLEQKMPQLMLNYRTNRLNSVVINPHLDKP